MASRLRPLDALVPLMMCPIVGVAFLWYAQSNMYDLAFRSDALMMTFPSSTFMGT